MILREREHQISGNYSKLIMIMLLTILLIMHTTKFFALQFDWLFLANYDAFIDLKVAHVLQLTMNDFRSGLSRFGG